MIKVLSICVSTFLLSLSTHWSESLNQFNGLSYIQAAEDLMSDGVSNDELRNVEHLFVLASIVDPQLRKHSVLGLIDIETDATQRNKLKALIPSTEVLVVPTVVQNDALEIDSQIVKTSAICETLTKMRKGQSIDQEELDLLNPWFYLFNELPKTTVNQARRTTVSDSMLNTTLHVELQVLGGATMWSADFVSTNGSPATMNINEDLATMYNVNPKVRLFKNGEWQEPS